MMPFMDLRGDENYEQQSITPKSKTFKDLKTEIWKKKQKYVKATVWLPNGNVASSHRISLCFFLELRVSVFADKLFIVIDSVVAGKGGKRTRV